MGSDSRKVSTRYDFQPAVGTHLMRYGGTRIKVEQTREQRTMEPWETVELTTLGNGILFRHVLYMILYMTTVEVTYKDKSYLWLLQWISQKGARKTQRLSGTREI